MTPDPHTRFVDWAASRPRHDHTPDPDELTWWLDARVSAQLNAAREARHHHRWWRRTARSVRRWWVAR